MRDTLIFTKIRQGVRWVGIKALEALVVVLVGSLAYMAGNGLLQSYLLPERLQRIDEAMQKKFEDRLSSGRARAIEREAALLQQMEQYRQERQRELDELRAELHLSPKSRPPSDPDSARYHYIESHQDKPKE